ncbi:sulfatase-like hydrolase/transferase, partial [bacterium]|nr:sulfatase-like hydrolase/transferase [bacterium]
RNGMYDMIRNNEVNYGHKFDEMMYSVSPEMTLGMDLREITIGEQLQQAGYTTGIVGKWDGGRARRYLPFQRGFDFFYGFANTGIDYYTHERYGIPSMFSGNERIKEEGYATNLFRREAVNFIRENKDNPFFLYVPFNSPHNASNLDGVPQQAPDEYIKMYGVEPPSERKIRYKANITCMDDAVGEILSTLKELGLEENTLVMFSSDNGGSGAKARNDPLRGGKGQMYEGGVRVPFIAKFPGLIPAGSESREFSSTLDIFPTLCSLANIKTPKNTVMDGYNILPILEGKGKSQQKEMFFEMRHDKAARVNNWKWVDSPRYQSGLFDLSNDIGEKNDLSEEKPEILKMVKDKWLNWKKEMDDTEPRGPFRNF